MNDRQNIMINQWTSNTEILRVKPDGEFTLGNGVDPLVALGELSKAFIRQQDRIKRLEEAGNEMFKWSERVGQEYWLKAREAKP